MNNLEFWSVTPTAEKTFRVRPVFQEMQHSAYEFDTECAALAAKQSLDNIWPDKWDIRSVPYLHYREDAPQRLRSLTISNNRGATKRHTVLSVTPKAVNLNGEWVPRKALYSPQKTGVKVWFLRRWFTEKLTREQQLRLGLV